MTTKMESQQRRLVFADKKLEEAYRKLQTSSSQAEKRLYGFITSALCLLLKNHSLGEQISQEQIPRVYKRMFKIKNLWVLDIPPEWQIFYSLAGNQIQIIDMTCDGRTI